jgi:hypothetical protein
LAIEFGLKTPRFDEVVRLVQILGRSSAEILVGLEEATGTVPGYALDRQGYLRPTDIPFGLEWEDLLPVFWERWKAQGLSVSKLERQTGLTRKQLRSLMLPRRYRFMRPRYIPHGASEQLAEGLGLTTRMVARRALLLKHNLTRKPVRWLK